MVSLMMESRSRTTPKKRNKSRGRGLSNDGSRQANKASICIGCKRGGGRCSWSQRFEPVPGWTAEKVIIRTQSNGKARHEEIYKVIDCPSYQPRKGRE